MPAFQFIKKINTKNIWYFPRIASNDLIQAALLPVCLAHLIMFPYLVVELYLPSSRPQVDVANSDGGKNELDQPAACIYYNNTIEGKRVSCRRWQDYMPKHMILQFCA